MPLVALGTANVSATQSTTPDQASCPVSEKFSKELELIELTERVTLFAGSDAEAELLTVLSRGDEVTLRQQEGDRILVYSATYEGVGEPTYILGEQGEILISTAQPVCGWVDSVQLFGS